MSSALFGKTQLLQPTRRDWPIDVFLGEAPVVQAFLTRMPGEVGAAIIDHGRETDSAFQIVQENKTQTTQFRKRDFEFLICFGQFFLDLITPLAPRPIERPS